MKKLLWLLLLSGSAWGQGFFWSLPSSFPNTTILVCPISTANPCPTPSNIFSDVGLAAPVSNPSNIGPGGGFGFFAAAAQYQVFLGAPSFKQFTVTLGGSGAAGTAFNAITGGTNTTAAMVVGTGASLTTSGTGTITATLPIAGTTIKLTNTSPTAFSFDKTATTPTFGADDANLSAGTITTSANGSQMFSLSVVNNLAAGKFSTNNAPCNAVGTSANPSLVACGAAPAGEFSCATTASTGTCVISTTAIGSSAPTIIVQPNSAAGLDLGVTCNTTPTVPPAVLLASKANGVSFTINMSTITVNPECYSYWIIN